MDAKTFIQFRLTHRLTQKELAEFLGISNQAVSHIETRRMDIPKRIRNLMWKLIDEYGINREIFVTPGVKQYRIKAEGKQKEREVEVNQGPIGEEIKGYNKQGTIDELGSLPPASDHYHTTELDPIGLSEKLFSKEKLLGFYQVNVIKYMARYGVKGGYNKDDLDKAQFYLDKIKELGL